MMNERRFFRVLAIGLVASVGIQAWNAFTLPHDLVHRRLSLLVFVLMVLLSILVSYLSATMQRRVRVVRSPQNAEIVEVEHVEAEAVDHHPRHAEFWRRTR